MKTKNLKTFDVFIVEGRDGSYTHRGYRVILGRRVNNPPKTLEREFVGRYDTLYKIDAERAAIHKTLGD